MTAKINPTQIIRFVAGSLLAVPGLFLLIGDVNAIAAQWRHLITAIGGEDLGLLPSVIWAASFNPQHLFHSALQMLGMPFVLLFVGVALLPNISAGRKFRLSA
jgi:hypothetical protein